MRCTQNALFSYTCEYTSKMLNGNANAKASSTWAPVPIIKLTENILKTTFEQNLIFLKSSHIKTNGSICKLDTKKNTLQFAWFVLSVKHFATLPRKAL